MDKIGALFRSRRVWAATAALLAVVLQESLGITEEQALAVVGIVGAWVVSDGLKNTE